MSLYTRSGEKRGGGNSSDTYGPVGDTDQIEKLILVRKFGTEENPSFVYRGKDDPEAEKIFEEAKRNRFLTMGWENKEEKEEFFRLAELWLENQEIFENLDPEFKQRILDSGILYEYKEIIDLYNKENQTKIENMGEEGEADA